MKRRAGDPLDWLGRFFDAAWAEVEDEEIEAEEGDDTAEEVAPAPPPPGDPRVGMRVLARLVADAARQGEGPETLAARAAAETAGAPRRRRKEPIRAFAAPSGARSRAG